MPAYKDAVRGTWYVSCYYKDWTGKRKVKKHRGLETKREALAWEREFLTKSAGSPDMTFATLFEVYFDDMTARLRKLTCYNIESIVHRHILPFLGSMPINRITPAIIRQWQQEIMAKNFTPPVNRVIHGRLSAILNYAVRYYGLPSNPCTIAGAIGSLKSGSMRFWTLEEFNRFLPHVKKPAPRLGFELLFWGGLRFSELQALTPGDVDFDAGTISITKGYHLIRGESVIAGTKTLRSTRTIPLPAPIMGHLREYVNKLYDCSPEDRLFTACNTVYRDAIKRACKETGIDRIRVHDLRHSHASLLIDMDVPIMMVAERLGHEDVKTTMGTYGHLYQSRRDDTIAKLNALAGG